jgi:hypothetical protein
MRKATLNCPSAARRKFLQQVLRRLLKYSYIANRLFKMGSFTDLNSSRRAALLVIKHAPSASARDGKLKPIARLGQGFSATNRVLRG